MNKQKKCIIIGSGLGGLSCGVILAKNGYDVTVLEQSHQPGGCMQCFVRNGAKFETGMHFIGSASPGQTLHKMLKYLNVLDYIKLSQLDTTAYDIVSLRGERFKFANGRERFIEQMCSYFPKEKDNLIKYFDIIDSIAEASSLHSLRHTEQNIAANSYYQTVSINDVLDSVFNDNLLKNVIAGNIPLYAAEKDRTPFSQHAFIMDFYNQSAYRIVGGSDTVVDALIKELKAHGGEIYTSSKASKIICDSKSAIGVEINGKETIPTDMIISTIHPAALCRILDTPLIRPAFKKRMTTLKNTVGGFSLYVKFKPDAMPYMNSNFYSYGTSSPWGCENYTEEQWPKGYLYMHMCHELNARFASSGVILSYMNMADVAKWSNTSIGRRGKDYEDFKKSKAEKLLKIVSRDFPEFSSSIDKIYTATPLTYRDYTSTEDGAMYGVAKDITLGIGQRVPHKTRIPNLLLSGQNINSHGMLGVLVGSIVTCSEILGSEHINNQIIEVCQ